MLWNEISMLAKAWVKEAGTEIKRSFSNQLDIKFKTDPSDLVTNMDKEIEHFFISKIKSHFPDHKVLGEEGQGDEISTLSGVVWILDPIDGTMNFVHMQRNFAISLGIYHNGVGMIGIIYDVVQDEMYYAVKEQGAYLNGEKLEELKQVEVGEAVLGMNASWVLNESEWNLNPLPGLIKDLRGTRSYGSAAIEMAYVAANRTDGYLTLRLSPWDFAAGKIIIEEVGGKVTTVKGKVVNMLTENTVFVAKPGLHESILANYLMRKNELE